LAEAQLKKDMDKGIHLKMKPAQMRASNTEYQKYPAKVFSDHIHQEVRARKFQTFLHDKNEEKKKQLGKT
jgi:hypothetical protein